ncbi:MAG: Phytoene dehydrogenase-related protein/NAD-binding domain and a Fe-S cluster-containing protein [Verrucomicrobia bacterium]|jgi:phytoene desaturase|nr:MAG: Phytoene dehydrogenase-related protein/NAD-binding domain and a Fe-S cluster-containing protein [Verrucomicrobiota bacterium]
MKNERVGIIGGGLAGLSAAVVLAGRGHKVTLFEANPWIGGKAAQWEQEGYRFDMGPTILTLPSVLRKVCEEAGTTLEKEFNMVRLDPQWRSFFTDGSVLDLVENVDAMAGNAEAFAPGKGAGEGYRKLLALSEKLNTISQKYFFYKAIGGIKDMFRPGEMVNPGVLRDVLTMRMGQSVGSVLRQFVPDAKISQMMDHFTQYVGSCPETSPAVLCGIAHMQTDEGVWYPIGGTRAVPVVLGKIAERLGVEIRSDSEVKRILQENGRATGVELASGERVALSAVVSNMDSVRTHRELVGGPAAAAFEARRKYEPACSGVVLYLGLRERYEHLLHHNFVFSRDPHEEFEAIYRKGEPAPDPTAYVCAPSGTEPAVAPPGGEALYVLVHTPYLRPHHDWKAMLPAYRRVILEKLKTTGGMPDIEERIVTEHCLTPQGIHDRYRVLNGAIYGLASHGRFTGAFKPSNRSQDVRGLYLAGGAAHPGPGMPMVLMSGWIAADALHADSAA